MAGALNDPATVREEYETEERFLARRLAGWAELDGPRVEDEAIALVAAGPPGRVLDVGCGTGDFTQWLRAPVTGLDLSLRMAQLTHGRGLPAVRGSIEALPFASGTLDQVVANRVLYHLPNLDRALAEVARVLTPAGRLVVVTYGDDHLAELFDLLGPQPLANLPPKPQSRRWFRGQVGFGGPSASIEATADALGHHFARVNRREVHGLARFPDRPAILGFLAAYGPFAWFADVDLEACLARVHGPFVATYRHVVFLATAGSGQEGEGERRQPT